MPERARRTLWLALVLGSGAHAQAPVEGVNPADLLTQVQIAGEYNRLGNGAYQSAFAVKYDQSFAGLPFGINAELPLLYLGTPFGDFSGHGDLFVRLRYVKRLGAWALGAASEVVAPIGEPEFSSGRWQLNPAGLAVYAWDPFNISAVVHKRVFGYGSDDPAKADLNQYQWRFLQIHIWPTGWFAQADVSRWRDVRSEQGWNDLRVSVGKQLSATRRVQVELKKFTDSRENDLAVNLAFSLKL